MLPQYKIYQVACTIEIIVLIAVILVLGLSFITGMIGAIQNTMIRVPYFGGETASQLFIVSAFSLVTVILLVIASAPSLATKTSLEVKLMERQERKEELNAKKMDDDLKLIDENQKEFGYHSLDEMNHYLNGQLKEVNRELKN